MTIDASEHADDAPKRLAWALPNILRRADEHKARVQARRAARKAPEQAADDEHREGVQPSRDNGIGSTRGR